MTQKPRGGFGRPAKKKPAKRTWGKFLAKAAVTVGALGGGLYAVNKMMEANKARLEFEARYDPDYRRFARSRRRTAAITEVET